MQKKEVDGNMRGALEETFLQEKDNKNTHTHTYIDIQAIHEL
jgi:hypothetical protein